MTGLPRTLGLLALAAIISLVCLTAILSLPTHAVSFTVDTMSDAVDASPGNGVCATAGGQCSLRAAIQEANAGSNADTITLPAGNFVMSIAGRGEDLAATGDFDISHELTITGVSPTGTIIDGGEVDRIFDTTGNATVHLSELKLVNGTSGGMDGGGIYNRGSMTLSHVAVAGHHDDDGGGIMNAGTLTVDRSVFSDNVAGNSGGAILNEGTLTMTGSTVSDNRASAGAGIGNLSHVVVDSSTLTGNDSPTGRGGAVSNSGDAMFTNVTISGNGAGYSGAAVANFDSLSLDNVTIANNEGGVLHAAIDNNETALIIFSGTIVAQHSQGNCRNVGTITSTGRNLEDANSCGFGNAGDQVSIDPMLAGLASNGGSTQTQALLPGSPAIDTGPTAGCPSLDQRGFSRPADGDHNGTSVCDIGAYELGAIEPTPTATSTPSSTATSTPGTPTPTATATFTSTPGSPTPTATVTPTGTQSVVPPTLTPVTTPTQALTRTPTRTATRTPTRTRTPTGTPVIFAQVGDVDCDGAIDSIDAAIVLQYVAGLYEFSRCPVTGDVNHDGYTNSVDAAIILQYSAGLFAHWPP